MLFTLSNTVCYFGQSVLLAFVAHRFIHGGIGGGKFPQNKPQMFEAMWPFGNNTKYFVSIHIDITHAMFFAEAMEAMSVSLSSREKELFQVMLTTRAFLIQQRTSTSDGRIPPMTILTVYISISLFAVESSDLKAWIILQILE